MIPYSYNMVDMGGIDLAEANGTVVPGVYERITEAMNLCGDVILYHWKFAGIDIVPSAYAILQQANSILINGMIQVTELDVVTVIGLPPPIVPVSPLEVAANGLYEAEPPQSGFNPVRVSVPERIPIVEQITITQNGTYTPGEGIDGFNRVAVEVPEQNNIVSVDYGDYLIGWYGSRKVRRVLSSGDKLIAATYRTNGGYTSGCFCTLKDYGAVSNVISGDYLSKVTINGIVFPDEIVRPIYIYGGMNGGGEGGTIFLYFDENTGNLVTAIRSALSPDGLYAPTTSDNYGTPWQQMTDERKRYFLNLLLTTLD